MAKKLNSKKGMALSVLGALAVLVLADLTPLGGNLRFYSKWIQCGSRPVYTQKGAFATAGVPNYVYAPNLGFFRGSMPYYCSATDAERDGYSANDKYYDFPNLPEGEFQGAIEKSRNLD